MDALDCVLDCVEQTIRRYRLVEADETVVIGVSGGPDSLCLLHVLQQLAPRLRINLHVAHLNHGLRGAAAEEDAAFVRQLAAAWGLSCSMGFADVAALARQPGLSTEEAARRARYGFLRERAKALGAQAVAVGHNADDQAETVLMHFLRGSGLAGLRGMQPSAPLADYRLGGLLRDRSNKQPDDGHAPSGNTRTRLIRPLLFVVRADILRYCQEQGLEPRFDRSNEDITYFRNRLRHQLLPLLEEYNPQIRSILGRTATILGDDHALLRQQVREAWAAALVEETEDRLLFDLDAWQQLHVSLQRGVLRESIARLRHSLRNINFVHIENALWALREGTAGTRMTLPAGLQMVKGYTCFAVGPEGVEIPAGDVPLLDRERLDLAIPGTIRVSERGWQAETRHLSVAELPTGWDRNPNRWLAWLDAEVVGPRPVLRTRREGDRFQPLGMEGRSKLIGEFFTNEKVPLVARDRWPLLARADGQVAWICGLRVDQRARITDATQRVLQVRFLAPGEVTGSPQRTQRQGSGPGEP